MNEVLRQRLWRHIEALPEEKVYQVLDYIEFLTSKYAKSPPRPAGSSLLRFGERLEDKMRSQGVAIRAMRGALDAVGTADRVFSGISEAGKTILKEVNTGLQPLPAELPSSSESPEDSGEQRRGGTPPPAP
jgi:hypothetical protein